MVYERWPLLQRHTCFKQNIMKLNMQAYSLKYKFFCILSPICRVQKLESQFVHMADFNLKLTVPLSSYRRDVAGPVFQVITTKYEYFNLENKHILPIISPGQVSHGQNQIRNKSQGYKFKLLVNSKTMRNLKKIGLIQLHYMELPSNRKK